VPAGQITGKNHDIIDEFCRAFALSARAHGAADDVTYSVFCFADASHVERFCGHLGGDRFDPKDRGRGSAWFVRRKR
jgi:hypothetical protein